MTPQEAAGLQHNDVVLYRTQTWRVRYVRRQGRIISLMGRYGDQEAAPREVTLLWRREEVPADFQPQMLNLEQEAHLLHDLRLRIVVAYAAQQQQQQAQQHSTDAEKEMNDHGTQE